MPVFPYNGVWPTIADDVFIAPGAMVIGNVTIHQGASIWYNAVVRGDSAPIVIGPRTNIQDNCTLHVDADAPLTIGEECTIGHGAVVHGATIGERALVGMNAVILNGAVIGERAVVGALALVPAGFKVPPRTLAVGAPCVLKKQGDAGIAEMAFQNTERYHRYREEHLSAMWGTVVGPLNDKGVFGR